MIVPNKIVALQESIIYKMSCILENKQAQQHLHDLYTETSKYFANVDEFLLAIDVLYVLDLIDVDLDLGRIHYVD